MVGAVVTVTAAGAGCSLAYPLDELSTGAGTEDGGSADGGGGDTTTDATSADGSTDASAGDSAGGTWTAIFDDDFERSDPADVRGTWDEVSQSSDSVATIVTDFAQSGTRAVQFKLGSADGQKASHQKLMPIVTRFRYSFWVRFAAAPNRGVNLPGFVFADPVGVAIFATTNVDGTIDIAVQKNPFFFSSGAVTAPVGRWFPVVIECDATANTYSASIDGVIRVAARAVGVPTSPAPLIIRSGSPYATAGPIFPFLVDDVRLEVQR